MTRNTKKAQFAPGTVVKHRRFGYRGLIFDVDAEYSQSEEWFELMDGAERRKDRPWYHVLVDGETHTTYVSEDNLDFCSETSEFDHPLLAHLFMKADCGREFTTRHQVN